ncbi:MAG TPA: hypothetical protein VE152_10605 [Acidimicrobiales bacterium]|jgi:hypothetical protein|nr:hypothetical protein [Acidimicrobiales bacterium]
MPTRITPLTPGQSPDSQVNELLDQARASWWGDSAMFGVIGRQPELLKAVVPVFEAFFARGLVEPHIHELMRIKTGLVNDCAY